MGSVMRMDERTRFRAIERRLLTKAKALAAINAGIHIVRTFDGGFLPVGDTRVQGDALREHKVYDKHYPTRIDALAAAADALGLAPDPDIVGVGLSTGQSEPTSDLKEGLVVVVPVDLVRSTYYLLGKIADQDALTSYDRRTATALADGLGAVLSRLQQTGHQQGGGQG